MNHNLLSLDEIHSVQLDILSFLDEFCKKYNLRYYLAYGTLLGAVRHKGFIPWDDDVDVFMPRDDYEKLIELLNDDIYKIASVKTTKGFFYPFVKLYDSRTVLDEKMLTGYLIGVNIDIFPLDNIPSNKHIRRKLISRIDFYKKILFGKLFWLNRISPLKRAVYRITASLFSGKKVVAKISKIATRYRQDNTEFLKDIVWDSTEPFMKTEYFKDTVQLSFCDRLFTAPKEYDKILRETYGDYSKLPPEENRVAPHHFEAWMLDEESL